MTLHFRLFCCNILCLISVLVWGVDTRPILIASLPDAITSSYDLTWQVRWNTDSPLIVECEIVNTTGYRLSCTPHNVTWTARGGSVAEASRSQPLDLSTGKTYTFSLKRRAGVMALLCNHRFVGSFPAPTIPCGAVTFSPLPAGVTVTEARYHDVGYRIFGDDFMRPEALEKLLAHVNDTWVEDDYWTVEHYRRAHPGTCPKDPVTGAALANPWLLSFFPVAATATNGFWLLYTGDGPSWVVPQDTSVPATWDRYTVRVAVRPDYESEVGLFAAYQDPQNYVRFLWRAQDDASHPTAHAELLAMIDGQPHVLATSARGFSPEQWYTLSINLGWQRVQACIDGEVIFDVPNPGPVEGKIGLYANGALHPHRPQLDHATATMYEVTDAKTGKVTNDAISPFASGTCIYFDDVKLEDWPAIEDCVSSPYAIDRTGRWQVDPHGVMTAQAPGRWITGMAEPRYRFTTQLRRSSTQQAGVVVRMTAGQAGLLWVCTATGQELRSVTPRAWGPVLTHADTCIPPETWTTLQVETDGPYLACLVNGHRVMDWYDPTYAVGHSGLLAVSGGVQFRRTTITPLPAPLSRVVIHEGFEQDRYLQTWVNPESEWFPANALPVCDPLMGSAAPSHTTVAGLYWQRGGRYHDLRIVLPVQNARVLDGQILHCTERYQADDGYQWRFQRRNGTPWVQLWRKEVLVKETRLPLTGKSQLVIARQGSYLLLWCEDWDPDLCPDIPDGVTTQPLIVYRDPEPISFQRLGFTVTTPDLPAAALRVYTDGIQDAFETSPVEWRAQSGIWKVMARYSCQPKWNWFGGFGSGTPTVWHKARLDGDQTVEVYLGVKMQYDGMTEGETQRFRDLNVSICADGADVQSGYALIRAGRPNGTPVTQLLRHGVVVWESCDPAYLLPMDGTGHRQWFVTRLEKHGAEITVYLDNHLATTYVDPQPLAGGYVGVWSRNNGIIIGRANLAAATVTTDLSDEHTAMSMPAPTLSQKEAQP